MKKKLKSKQIQKKTNYQTKTKFKKIEKAYYFVIFIIVSILFSSIHIHQILKWLLIEFSEFCCPNRVKNMYILIYWWNAKHKYTFTMIQVHLIMSVFVNCWLDILCINLAETLNINLLVVIASIFFDKNNANNRQTDTMLNN